MPDPSLSERGPHDAAEELLPWYATGQLDREDRARVERHLYACAACRAQLAVDRRLVDQFHATTPEIENGWARIKARIEPPRPLRPKAPAFFADLRTLVSRPAVAALAAAQVAALALGAMFVSLSQPTYHVLGSAPTPASANVIVMFAADATEKDVRDALEAAGASIVGGPTSAGAYLLHVGPQGRQSALAKLHADAAVQLAEPVDGSGT